MIALSLPPPAGLGGLLASTGDRGSITGAPYFFRRTRMQLRWVKRQTSFLFFFSRTIKVLQYRNPQGHSLHLSEEGWYDVHESVIGQPLKAGTSSQFEGMSDSLQRKAFLDTQRKGIRW